MSNKNPVGCSGIFEPFQVLPRGRDAEELLRWAPPRQGKQGAKRPLWSLVKSMANLKQKMIEMQRLPQLLMIFSVLENGMKWHGDEQRTILFKVIWNHYGTQESGVRIYPPDPTDWEFLLGVPSITIWCSNHTLCGLMIIERITLTIT